MQRYFNEIEFVFIQNGFFSVDPAVKVCVFKFYEMKLNYAAFFNEINPNWLSFDSILKLRAVLFVLIYFVVVRFIFWLVRRNEEYKDTLLHWMVYRLCHLIWVHLIVVLSVSNKYNYLLGLKFIFLFLSWYFIPHAFFILISWRFFFRLFFFFAVVWRGVCVARFSVRIIFQPWVHNLF